MGLSVQLLQAGWIATAVAITKNANDQKIVRNILCPLAYGHKITINVVNIWDIFLAIQFFSEGEFMATYAIGDVQGCYLTLKKLLKTINFDKRNDQVIFLGDLINRGPRSLETLRFVVEHESSMTMVLGNHEIFTLALSMDAIKNHKAHTLDKLLAAKDAKKLLDWLKTKPIMIKQGPNVYVHAGILPAVSIDEAKLKADEISNILQSDEAEKFLRRFYEKTPKRLKDRKSVV